MRSQREQHRYLITYMADGDVTGLADVDLPFEVTGDADWPRVAQFIETRYGVRNVRIREVEEG